MLDWKAWFDSKILERGKDYFRSGAVQDLEIDEEEISAVVEGTEDYQVTISLDDGEIDEMDCSCPYAEEHECCKHMAAVLYAYEDTLKNKKSKDQSDKTEKLTREQLCALVEKTDVQTVRQFLTDVLWNEEKYRVRFQSMVSPDFAKQALDYAKKRLSKIERKYASSSGYSVILYAFDIDTYRDRFMIARFNGEYLKYPDILERARKTEAKVIYIMPFVGRLIEENRNKGLRIIKKKYGKTVDFMEIAQFNSTEWGINFGNTNDSLGMCGFAKYAIFEGFGITSEKEKLHVIDRDRIKDVAESSSLRPLLMDLLYAGIGGSLCITREELQFKGES